MGCCRHQGFGLGCRQHLAPEPCSLTAAPELSSDPWAEPFPGVSAFSPANISPCRAGWEMLPVPYSRRVPMALSQAKMLCRSTEPHLHVMAPWFGLCHLCLAAVHGPTNGSFLRVLISPSCRDVWVHHSRDPSSVRVLCSCLFACHVGCGPAQGRPQCRFVPAVDGAELCHRLRHRSLGCAVPAWGVLRTAGRSWMAAGSGRRWGMARGGLK